MKCSVSLRCVTVPLLLPFFFTTVTSEICDTQICQEAASNVLNTIDITIDPCYNFYKFACGGLFKKNLNSKPASLIALVENEVDNQIKTMLEEPSKNSEPKAIQSLKKFFKSCMDEVSIERNGVNTINKVLEQLGGWPVVNGLQWKENTFKVEDLLIKLRKLGYEYSQLFYFSISTREPDKIFVGTPITSLLKHGYHRFVTSIAILLGAEHQTASTELEEMLQFETKLSHIARKRTKSRKMTFKAMQQSHLFLNWLKLIQNIYPYQKYEETDQGYFPSAEYLINLDTLLKQTPNRTIANYIIWKAIEATIPYLPKAFRNHKIYYDIAISRTFAEKENDRLPPSLETLYFKKYFPFQRKMAIEEILLFIKNEFVNLLNNTDLYDEISRTIALKKAKLITHLVGGPNKLFHEEELLDVFNNYKMDNTDDCLTLASILNRQRNIYKLKRNTTLNEDYSLYIAVNAYYNSFTKSLIIPAAAMQGLYFNGKRPNYMNFGTLGMLVGHELTHAFGNNANKEDNSWTRTTYKRFYKRASCIIQQINNFNIEGSNLHMNGRKTLEETVCDFNGAKVAYQSYQSWLKLYGEEKQLPNLNYTSNQLFWISTASFFCDIISTEKVQELIDVDPHAHPEFRIFGSMSNSEDFAKDFNCPVGSRMNHSKKCRIF